MATTDPTTALPGGAALAGSAGDIDAGAGAVQARGYWENAFRRLRRDRLAIVSACRHRPLHHRPVHRPAAGPRVDRARPERPRLGRRPELRPRRPVLDRERRPRRPDVPRARGIRPGRARRVPAAAGGRAGVDRGRDPGDAGRARARGRAGASGRLLRRGRGYHGLPPHRDRDGLPAPALPDRHLGDGRRTSQQHHARRSPQSRGVHAHDGDRALHVVLPGPDHPRAGALAAGEGVHRGGPHGGVEQLPHHAVASPAAPRRDHHRVRHAHRRHQHPARDRRSRSSAWACLRRTRAGGTCSTRPRSSTRSSPG